MKNTNEEKVFCAYIAQKIEEAETQAAKRICEAWEEEGACTDSYESEVEQAERELKTRKLDLCWLCERRGVSEGNIQKMFPEL